MHTHIHKKIYHGRGAGKSELEILVQLKKEGISDEILDHVFSHHYPHLLSQKNHPQQKKHTPQHPLNHPQLITQEEKPLPVLSVAPTHYAQPLLQKRHTSRKKKDMIAAVLAFGILSIGIYGSTRFIPLHSLIQTKQTFPKKAAVAGEAIATIEHTSKGYAFSYPASFSAVALGETIVLSPKMGRGELSVRMTPQKKLDIEFDKKELSIIDITKHEEAIQLIRKTFHLTTPQEVSKEEVTKRFSNIPL